MKNTFKKIASLLLCLCLIISGMIISASAADTTTAYYEKVTVAPEDWSGKYLIVYEGENFAFNGSLATLDAASNYMAVTISDEKIAVPETDNFYFTIEAYSGGYSIKSASGKYIGKSTNANGLDSNADAVENTISFTSADQIDIVGAGGAYLRFNTTSGQDRFRYFKSSTYTNQKSIQLYKYTEVTGGEGGGEEPVDPPVTPDPEEPDTPVVEDPAADSTLTIDEANTLGASKDSDTYTEGKYYVEGIITEVSNTTYGNMTIKDATDETKTLYIYGSYSADGSTRYDALTLKHEAGDTVRVYGVIGNYNGTAQMQNGWVTILNDLNPPVEPEEPDTPDEPTGNTATITFDDASKRTTSDAEKQIWEENGVTVTNIKTSNSSALVENINPVRFYKNSIVSVEFSGGNITQIVFDANTSAYATAMQNSITSGGTATTSSDKVTFVPTAAAESFEFTLSGGQVRMDAITITYEAKAPVADMGNTSVDVKEDLAVNQEVTVKPEDIEGKELLMHFTMNGATTTVPCDPSQIVDNKFTFTFDNIGVQCMADPITATLVTVENDSEDVQATSEFSVKSYAKKVLETSTDAATKKFVSDMLRYGAAAQTYTNHTENGLATDGLDTLLVEGSSTEVPKGCKMALTKSASTDIYFKGATVRFDNVNSLVIRLNSKTANTKVLVNDVEATLVGNDCIISDLKATDYATTYTFKLYEGDELIQTLTYGINSYAFSKQTSSNDAMAALAKALYAYGVSASESAN